MRTFCLYCSINLYINVLQSQYVGKQENTNSDTVAVYWSSGTVSYCEHMMPIDPKTQNNYYLKMEDTLRRIIVFISIISQK